MENPDGWKQSLEDLGKFMKATTVNMKMVVNMKLILYPKVKRN